MTELIITEKPQAAEKIANALSDGKLIKNVKNKVVYYEITHKGNKIYIGCAVGHLYGLSEKTKSKWGTYPIFDIEWKPKFEIDKSANYTKPYLTVLKQLGKEANKIIVATDFDIEGSVIGYNIVTKALGKKDARRMKFSTLTKDELIDSYEHSLPHLEFPMIYAGEARHNLDWFYGINLTNALSTSIKIGSGKFKVLSSGRVQSPTLKLIVEREKEIQKFIPETYWEIFLDGLIKNNKLLAKHYKDKFNNHSDVKKILDKTKGSKAFVTKIEKSITNQSPPTPFDLTTLQIESFKQLRISPKETAQIAQELYISGLISYPRTSSQKLPSSIGYKKILKKLSELNDYSMQCQELLTKKSLIPNEGKKTDPAHPAIYPTGENESISGNKLKLYDLIVRRFLAVFGEPAKRQSVIAKIDVNKEIFTVSGITTIEPGWHILYGKYADFKEEELPEMKEGDEVKIKKIYDEEKQTQPPKRYTQASIIKKMESLNLGTKSTRASILDTLYDRAYVKNQPIEATELGIRIVDTLRKYSPEVLDEKLTSTFEKEMEQIEKGKKTKEEVILHAEKILKVILKKFKENEKLIGIELADATKETENKMNELGECIVCKKGKLRIMYSKLSKKRFVACDQYPNCKTTYSLPQQGLIKSAGVCKHDGFVQVMIIRKGKRPWALCLNQDCPSKKNWSNSNNF